MTAYKLKTDSIIEEGAVKGTLVWPCTMNDYGCASDDTHFTGRIHISLSLKPDGGYPFFTHPEDELERVPE